MSNLLDNWQSSEDMLAVRENRRRRLCKALTYIGSAFLLAFGLLALVQQNHALGTVLLGSAGLGIVNSFLLSRRENLKIGAINLSLILLTLIFTLLATGGVQGTGLLWIYPIFAILMFINPFRTALTLSLLVVGLIAVLLFSPLSDALFFDYSSVHALRFLMTLIALQAISLTAIYAEESAYRMLLRLHNADIHRLAFFDPLTGLPNRWTLQSNLERLLGRQQRDDALALMYIDLDNFKHVNDNYGHAVGDRLLESFGQRLRESIGAAGTVLSAGRFDDGGNEAARLAGDEFVVLLTQLDGPAQAKEVAERILQLFQGGFELNGSVYPVFASIGVAVSPHDTRDASELLRYADAAMYLAKSRGNNCLEFFTSDIADVLDRHQRIENGLRAALADDSFYLVYSPMQNCASGAVAGLEALLRSDHPALEGFGPHEFIPVAESTGLIRDIDNWVLRNGLDDLLWLRDGAGFNGIFCINVSGVELLKKEFPREVQALLDERGLAASQLELEITETSLVPDNPVVLTVLKEFNELGVSLALDDFGTGYTSFNQLILYPANTLKIDRSFVEALWSDREGRGKVVEVILNLASIYGLRVVAEGVETQEQLHYLQRIGCDWVQGHWVSDVLDRDGAALMLARQAE